MNPQWQMIIGLTSLLLFVAYKTVMVWKKNKKKMGKMCKPQPENNPWKVQMETCHRNN